MLSYLTQTLGDLGYRVASAIDAATALDRLDGLDAIDMLLTDVVMPGEINGEQLAQQVRKRLPDLPVLYISGYTRDALVEQGALKTGVSLLAKPFTRSDLAQHVRAVLDGALTRRHPHFIQFEPVDFRHGQDVISPAPTAPSSG